MPLPPRSGWPSRCNQQRVVGEQHFIDVIRRAAALDHVHVNVLWNLLPGITRRPDRLEGVRAVGVARHPPAQSSVTIRPAAQRLFRCRVYSARIRLIGVHDDVRPRLAIGSQHAARQLQLLSGLGARRDPASWRSAPPACRRTPLRSLHTAVRRRVPTAAAGMARRAKNQRNAQRLDHAFSFNACERMPINSSMCFGSMMSAGESAMMSPVVRISRPRSKHLR